MPLKSGAFEPTTKAEGCEKEACADMSGGGVVCCAFTATETNRTKTIGRHFFMTFQFFDILLLKL